jgi:hypothetical protein
MCVRPCVISKKEFMDTCVDESAEAYIDDRGRSLRIGIGFEMILVSPRIGLRPCWDFA